MHIMYQATSIIEEFESGYRSQFEWEVESGLRFHLDPSGSMARWLSLLVGKL